MGKEKTVGKKSSNVNANQKKVREKGIPGMAGVLAEQGRCACFSEMEAGVDKRRGSRLLDMEQEPWVCLPTRWSLLSFQVRGEPPADSGDSGGWQVF